ncbi:glycoside hydrolase family 10 protein [Isoptericola sp. BMS4]|uniref:glycoside hydrolase family 10 protein n=1 Tax=Isoptericola sp. BMS4 TaxID=2527875 RepID=UPI00141DD400|nr:family 10 glycosylhydrolase [Isoptericola sp. BMS4]
MTHRSETTAPAPAVDRRGFLTLATAGLAGSALSVTIGSMSPASAAPLAAAQQSSTTSRKRELRAMWIASVVNIDWPSRTGLSAEELKAEYLHWLDVAVEYNLNAVFVQVRPTADAFWPSPYEPWSQYLTGTQGQGPGFDPLAFIVDETHQRNLELHAWYNPYRVSMQNDPAQLVPEHPARQHPDWVWAYGPKLYFDPGIPEAREHIYSAILHSVEHYDVDGVHFDDYFYPYPSGDLELPDAGTYATYGGGFDSIEAWRRDNVNTFVREISERIKALKPWVKFGISPFGIWRNASTDPLGSDTAGFEAYDQMYADTRHWVTEGWLDYINPQIYWQFGLAVADYLKLVPWWADVAAQSGTHLYVGEALYKVTSGAFTDPEEMTNHLTYCAELDDQGTPVHGNVYFSANHIPQDVNGAMTRVRQDHYSRPALVPVMPHLPARRVRVPLLAEAVPSPDGVTLKWVDAGPRSGAATSFAVYRADGHGVVDVEDATHLVATVRADHEAADQTFTDATAVPGQAYTYVVTALDRLWNESRPSRTRRV